MSVDSVVQLDQTVINMCVECGFCYRGKSCTICAHDPVILPELHDSSVCSVCHQTPRKGYAMCRRCAREVTVTKVTSPGPRGPEGATLPTSWANVASDRSDSAKILLGSKPAPTQAWLDAARKAEEANKKPVKAPVATRAKPASTLSPKGKEEADPSLPTKAIPAKGDKCVFTRVAVLPTVSRNDALCLTVAAHLGINVEAGTVDERNAHRLAELVRFAVRSKLAHLVTRLLQTRVKKANQRELLDFVILFPSNTEVAAYRKMMFISVAGADAVPVNTDGYRLSLVGTDLERGRMVYPTSLSSTSIFVGGDIAYYFSPEKWIQMFHSHPAVKGGLTVFLSGRHFCKAADSLHVDHFSFAAREEATVPREVAVRTMVPALTGNKTVKTRVINGKAEVVMKEHITRETTQVTIPAISAVDYVEGHGLCDGTSLFTYFASRTPGDSVYVHKPGELDGMFVFEYSKYAVEMEIDGVIHYYQISMHMEWACAAMSVVRMDLREIDHPGVTIPVNRSPPAFVQAGIIPRVFSSLVAKAGGLNPEMAESVKSLFDSAYKNMIRELGKTAYETLPFYHNFLTDASRRTAEKAIVASRYNPAAPIPIGGSFEDHARDNAAARIVSETHVPTGVADAYVRLTSKQTRAQFIVQLVRSGYELLAWVWEKIRGFFSKAPTLAITSYVVEMLAALRRTSSKFRSYIDKITAPIMAISVVRNSLLKVESWASKYPKTVLVFEEAATAVQCIVIAFGEEFAKRYTPVAFSALFGAVEAALGTIVYAIDHDFSKQSIALCIGRAVAQVAMHLILRLIPMWVAVPAHAIYNYLVGRGKTRWWNDLIAALAPLPGVSCHDDFDSLFVGVHTTVPKNVIEQCTVYTKEPDGSKVYIKDQPDFLELVAVKTVSKRCLTLISDATAALVESNGTLLDFILLTVARLDKPVPYTASQPLWDKCMALFVESYCLPIMEEEGPCRTLDNNGLIEYIQHRPWGEARKEATITIVLKGMNECKLQRPKTLNAKVELLPGRDDLVAPDAPSDEDSACKTRPIGPRAEEDVSSMKLAVPVKHYMNGHRFWAMGPKGWDYVGKVKDCQVPSLPNDQFILSMDYQMAPRADHKSQWINRCRRIPGIHCAKHGDDNYTLFVSDDHVPTLLACAIDLAQCDLTCAKIFQRAFCTFLNLVTEDSNEEEVQKQYDLLTGEFRLESRQIPADTPDLFWNKTQVNTNTGEPLTSVKAVFGQSVATFPTVASCVKDGRFEPALYKAAVFKYWRGLGLNPEFEEDPEGEIWHHPSAVTYLGGFFVQLHPDDSDSDWAWVSNKQIKAYMVFPDVARIHGQAYPYQKHMAMLLSDPDLRATPVGRAIARWYERCCDAVFSDVQAVAASALQQYVKYLEMQDRYKLEQMAEVGDYEAPTVSDEAYYHAADKMLARLGGERSCIEYWSAEDIRTIVSEIDCLGTAPVQPLDSSVYPLYALRFGAPKAGVEDIIQLQELSFLGAIFDLGKKIIHSYLRDNDRMGAETKTQNHQNAKKSIEAANRQATEKVVKKAIKEAARNAPGPVGANKRVGEAAKAMSNDIRRQANSNALAKRKEESQGHKNMEARIEKHRKELSKTGVGLLPSYEMWLQSAERPLTEPARKCPVQKNPIESYRTSPVTTTYTMRQQISPGSKLDIILFPGHGAMPSDPINATDGTFNVFNMDPTSFHSVLQNLPGGGTAVIGPMPDGQSSTNTCGVYRAGNIDELFLSSSAASGVGTFTNVTPLPYTASPSNSSHTRWRQTAMGIKFILDDADGSLSVKTATPMGKVHALAGSISFDSVFAKDPSYRKDQLAPVSGKGVKEVAVPWQTDQLAFWHAVDKLAQNGVPTNSVKHGSFFLQAENLETSACWVDIEICCHWELSGDNLLSVSSPTSQSISSANVADMTAPRLSALGSASQASVATKSTLSETISSFGSLLGTGLQVAKFAASLF